jgi:tryptophan halogenase
MPAPLKVVIVGGGTAGWMCAAALVGAVRPGVCEVRLVESDEIGIVGVGEATLPQIKEFNEYIGVIEADFMRKTNATFKLGIEFVDWGFKGSSYIHPFGVHGKPMGGVPFYQYWTKARQSGRTDDIEDFCLPIVASRLNRFDFPTTEEGGINSTFAYAYHFDANLYAGFLREFSEIRGLRRTEGKVVDVTLGAQDGHIATIALNSGEVIEGDLFIDCSGFRSLLMGKALDVGYEDWTPWLPCDRALAVPCERTGPLTPYTRSTAREAGWQWRIPLQHRTGNGYVYSSRFISDDEAAATLLANLDGAALDDPRPLRFQAGRREKSWHRNCIALGLASGFLEPLESTSIYLIQIAITNLLKLMPAKAIDPALVEEFNRLIDVEYERVRDFLILHYHANTRDDAPLWTYCREMDVPESLRRRMALFQHRGHIHKYGQGLFAPPSWLSVFVGQGLRPAHYDPLVDNLPYERIVAEMDALRDNVALAARGMSDHAAFVDDYCASPAAVRLREGVAS